MRVFAPNKYYCGRVGADVFINGVCEYASEAQRWYYVGRGYRIEDEGDSPVREVPSKRASVGKWRDFLESRGITYPDGAARSDLIRLWEESNGEVSS
ncbi:hypothetical protein F6I42_03510 [Corynebacterium amycolatum]|uniref:hypothetical protein n=1 Tax=Corynebacterium amycolatum TaxID=43765 RepID=UPI0012458E63|nr:hypothetical protein [Corynebacterium amycolatum]KAA9227051.1 hypothetical protein F6I42_03510 [Corynebacterium amycolatum]